MAVVGSPPAARAEPPLGARSADQDPRARQVSVLLRAAVSGASGQASAQWPCEDCCTADTVEECRTVADDVTVEQVGQTVEYTISVANPGPGAVTGVAVRDTLTGLPGQACTPAQQSTLQAGESMTCAADYVTTQADVDRGFIDDTATITATTSSGEAAEAFAAIRVPVEQSAGLSVTTSANKAEVSAVGELVTFETVTTNTGRVTLTDVAVTDPLPGLTSACRSTTLAPGDTLRCTGTYTVTAQDLQAGGVTSTAAVSAAQPGGGRVTGRDSLTVAAFETPVLRLTKRADVDEVRTPVDSITYTYSARNTGNTDLLGVVVEDPLFRDGQIVCEAAMPVDLAPGDSVTCSATHAVTQKDIDRGGVDTGARAAGAPPEAPAVSTTATAPVPAAQDPRVTLRQSAEQASFSAPRTRLTYAITAENEGNVTVTGVGFDAPHLSDLRCHAEYLGGADAPLPADLAPGESLACRGSYPTTQGDIDGGGVEHVTRVVADPPTGPSVAAESSVEVPAEQIPALALVKSADPRVIREIDDEVEFTYTARNTGNTTLKTVEIVDESPELTPTRCSVGDEPAGQPVDLPPGDAVTCRVTYRATDDDIDSGGIDTGATATARAPDGSQVGFSDDETVQARPSGRLEVSARAGRTTVDAAGDTVEYAVDVRNTGSGSVTGVTLDPGAVDLRCDSDLPVDLARGGRLDCTGTLSVTQDQIDDGGVRATFVASGTAPDSSRVTARDAASVAVSGRAVLALSGSAEPVAATAAGQTVEYRFVARNSGNRTLSGVTVRDASPGGEPLTCDPAQPASLAPGDSTECTASRTVTQDDVDAGGLDLAATATATSPTGAVIGDVETVRVDVARVPGLAVRTGPVQSRLTDTTETVAYPVTATNTGNVTLGAVAVSAGDAPVVCTPAAPAELAPGATAVCSVEHTLDAADVGTGGVLDRVAVTGRAPAGNGVSATDSVAVPALQTSGLSLHADVDDALVGPGQRVQYSFSLVNTGNQSLADVAVRTDAGAAECAQDGLAPGERTDCALTYSVTDDDVATGGVVIAAAAEGLTPVGTTVGAAATRAVETEAPELSVAARADKPRVTAVGEPVEYTVEVVNSGNVALADVEVRDSSGPLPLSCTPPAASSLAPGESLSCSSSQTVDEAELARDAIDNQVIATGTPPTGPTVTATDAVTVAVDADPATLRSSLTLTVTTDPPGTVARGTQVAHTYTLTNTGEEPLTAVQVSDEGCSQISGGVADPLAPDASAEYTCTGAPTRTVDRQVTASAQDGSGERVQATARVRVEVSTPEPTACPIDVTLERPKPTKAGNRVLVQRVETDPSCRTTKPRAICRPLPGSGISEGAFCQTVVSANGRVQVRTGGFDAVRIGVTVIAKPRAGDDMRERSRWEQSWVLR
jgi:uncharacterized repeat protein (TIGR01451 family)